MQISIHAPPRGATVSPDSEGKLYIFQFTPLREGRRKVNDTYEEAPIFQFTPLREGRPMPLSSSPALLISIHAPPRGATKGIYGGEVSLLFQFTPLREGRLVRSPYDGSEEQFQFTPLREGRRSAGLGRSRSNISIHAPPRGATDEDKAKLWDNKFQFTPLREGRRFSAAYVEAHDDFNSRPSARGDTYSPKQPHLPTHFNSRPSARGDIKLQVRLYSSPFQFTPLREGRQIARGNVLAYQISIHAPPRGATAKDMQFLQIFCSTLTNQHGLTIMPRNLSRLFW